MMLEYISTDGYALAWLTAPAWIVSPFAIPRVVEHPERIPRLRYWSFMMTLGVGLHGLLPAFWIASEVSVLAGYLLLAAAVSVTGTLSAWSALARTRDMGMTAPLLAAFSWFPLVGIVTVFGPP